MNDISEGLILSDENGRHYTNQTGGYACHHPVYNGKLVELHFSEDFYTEVDVIFDGKYKGWCSTTPLKNIKSGIDLDDAKILNKIFEKFFPSHFIVDEELLGESEEAWIHVIDYRGIKGVLTFENSD